jgi:hypothetical protein
MPRLELPAFPDHWSYFAATEDLLFGLLGLLLIVLLSIWWRQRLVQWWRVVLASLLLAMILCTASYYLFESPPYQAGCTPPGCTGYRGYPLPVARVEMDKRSLIGPLDFALNLILLWLLWLTASVIWTLLALAFEWWRRGRRWRILFVLIVGVLPWAVLPRALNPPAPIMAGEDLRIAINGRRAAEFTYNVTGFWVLRLALEDVRRLSPEAVANTDTPTNQVCLRGYTYFFWPWQRYRVDLDPNGITPLGLTTLPLDQPCW